MENYTNKILAVLLSALLVFTVMSVGLTAPAYAVDSSALDAAVSEAEALTASDYKDFSGVLVALNNASDITGKTQTEIDDLENALRVAMAKLELSSKYTPASISVLSNFAVNN